MGIIKFLIIFLSILVARIITYDLNHLSRQNLICEDIVDGTKIPNKADCTSFYFCDHGKAEQIYCSAGLHFDSVYNVCNWPSLARCDLDYVPPIYPSSTQAPIITTQKFVETTHREVIPTRPVFHTSQSLPARPPSPKPTEVIFTSTSIPYKPPTPYPIVPTFPWYTLVTQKPVQTSSIRNPNQPPTPSPTRDNFPNHLKTTSTTINIPYRPPTPSPTIKNFPDQPPTPVGTSMQTQEETSFPIQPPTPAPTTSATDQKVSSKKPGRRTPPTPPTPPTPETPPPPPTPDTPTPPPTPDTPTPAPTPDSPEPESPAPSTEIDPSNPPTPPTAPPPTPAIPTKAPERLDPLKGYDLDNIQCLHDGLYFLPHPTKCDVYFICENRHLHMHSCGNGIHWNYIDEKCDLPRIARCYFDEFDAEPSTTVRPSTTVLPMEDVKTTIGVVPPMIFVTSRPLEKENEEDSLPDCPSYQTFYPHAHDCKKYYICIGGAPILTSCPDDLYWNAKELFCGSPETTECSNLSKF